MPYEVEQRELFHALESLMERQIPGMLSHREW